MCCRAVPCCARWEGLRRRQIGPPVVFSRNAAAADKSFIRLVLRYRARYTLPQQFTQSAQHKDTASQQPPPLTPTPLQPPHPQPSFFLPLSLSPPPPTPPLPSSGHSRQYASLTLANQRFTLDAQMEEGGGWGGGIKALIHGEGG